MKFLNLTFENFLSYREKQQLQLFDQGLVLIRGENKLSNSSDSNGAGKTAIFDALAWVLYGRTLRGLRADEVACRFTKEQCLVSLNLESHGKTYTIVRSRRPATVRLIENSRFWEGKDADSVIEHVIGFGFRTFCNAVMFGQGAFERFALAESPDQLKMLDEIQSVDFQESLNRARGWRDIAVKQRTDLQDQLNSCRIVLQGTTVKVQELETIRIQFDLKKKSRIRELEEKISALTSRIFSTQEKLTIAQKKQEELTSVRKRWETFSSLQERMINNQREFAHLLAEKAVAEESISRIQNNVNSLLTKGRCPTCRMDFQGKEKDLYSSFAPDLLEAQAALFAIDKTIVQHREKLEKLESDVNTQRNNFPTDFDNRILARLESETGPAVLSLMQRDLSLVESEILMYKNNMEIEENKIWEGEDTLNQGVEKIKNLTEQISELEKSISKASKTVQAAEYWVEAFGDRGIRNLLFDSLSDFLNERVNYHLSVLSGGEARIQLSSLTPLKGGGIREKLSVGVEWEGGASSYSGGSGGQDRRIDLALFAALQDVAESMSASPFPLKVWDQPDDNLDSRGQEIFCQWVEHEARTRGSGFLITHSQELANMVQPDTVWTVVLDKRGSHVEV